MISGLRAKLNALHAAPAAKPQKRACAGVKFYSARVPADARLFDLDIAGLRRIGWTGARFDARKCLFLDTETTGLSGGAGTVAFLVGLGFIEGDTFVVEQYLMGDYPDEPEMLAKIAERMKGYESVCSFNGNRFDLPLLQNRFTMCRMRELYPEMEQLDLLYPARRTWKLRIGSCKLSRIEEYILDAPRGEDLPGSEVPQRYFDYLKSGDAQLLEEIIDHNRQDIITLGVLLGHLCELYAHPERSAHQEDLFSMGMALEKQGELKNAGVLYRIAAVPAPVGSLRALRGDPIAAKASWQLYCLARKSKDREAMREILENMASRRQLREKVYIELSKLYEHYYKNYTRALRYADLGARYAEDRDREEISKRRERLNGKIERGRKKNNGIFRQLQK